MNNNMIQSASDCQRTYSKPLRKINRRIPNITELGRRSTTAIRTLPFSPQTFCAQFCKESKAWSQTKKLMWFTSNIQKKHCKYKFTSEIFYAVKTLSFFVTLQAMPSLLIWLPQSRPDVDYLKCNCRKKIVCCQPMLHTLFQQVNKLIDTVAALLVHVRAMLHSVSPSLHTFWLFLILFYSWPQTPQDTAASSCL